MNFNKLQIRNDLVHLLMDSIDDYVYIGDLQTNIFFVSKNMVDDFDLPGQQIEDLVTVWGRLIHEKDKERFFVSIQNMLDGLNDIHVEEYQIINKKGEYVWVHCKGRLLRDKLTNKPTTFAGIVKKSESMGKIDFVTGLFTHEKLKSDILNENSDGILRRGGAILIGIDEFRKINVMENHGTGDAVLRHVAQSLQMILPANTFAYRFDGDEFFIINLACSKQHLIQIYYAINNLFENELNIDGKSFRLTISAGILSFSDYQININNLDKYTDLALRLAKENGRNRFEMFNISLITGKIREQKILRELHSSVNNGCDGFYLVYQPILSIDPYRINGAEALLRYRSNEFGELGPCEFIPLLEQAGLICEVGKWVAKHAMKDCVSYIKIIHDFTLNINVSPLQLNDCFFFYAIQAMLIEHQINPKHIVLEITESCFSCNTKSEKDNVDYLSNIGVMLAIDDFGTGYSSLSRLSQMKVTTVKIDRDFVHSLYKSNFNYAFVESIIRLCHSINMKVCVEGVESLEQFKDICGMRADKIQGYFVSKPLKKEVFVNYLTSNSGGGLKELPDIFKHEAEIQHETKKLIKAINSIPVCLSVWSPEFEILTCNRQALKLFGIPTRQEFIKKFFNLSPTYQPDGQPSINKVHEKISLAIEKGSCSFKWLHQNSEGVSMQLNVTMFRTFYNGKYAVIAITHDK
ncbi:EAL domain-containing protein [Laribacter hongkongensis]|uniref:EAL domain-containing protein n=1 Tax=Laribacter hongkongensis TaxID=168471 RepID=UPI001EFD9607|nr:EAL domain-containing protein [Laribacter hongkongensis]MCG9046949.1 EAL domain-containing protein [Laribacter hongkongensis]MCG9073432.1 EAL domain-containing protein [Laribacter hongkongensis]